MLCMQWACRTAHHMLWLAVLSLSTYSKAKSPSASLLAMYSSRCENIPAGTSTRGMPPFSNSASPEQQLHTIPDLQLHTCHAQKIPKVVSLHMTHCPATLEGHLSWGGGHACGQKTSPAWQYLHEWAAQHCSLQSRSQAMAMLVVLQQQLPHPPCHFGHCWQLLLAHPEAELRQYPVTHE